MYLKIYIYQLQKVEKKTRNNGETSLFEACIVEMKK